MLSTKIDVRNNYEATVFLRAWIKPVIGEQSEVFLVLTDVQ